MSTREITFHKMHGLGNDYIYIDLDAYPIHDLPSFARQYSDRRKGIGGDGVITYQREGTKDFRMRVFNMDGSEALMCGNAIRCVAKLLYESGRLEEGTSTLVIHTLSGAKVLELTTEGKRMISAKVDMNPPHILDSHHTITLSQKELTGCEVNVGNPHFVRFINSDVQEYPLDTEGPEVEHHEAFHDGINYEIANILTPQQVRMRVWERGSGLTQACGTGATAVAVAGIAQGCLKSPVTIQMPGGDLVIEWSGKESDSAFMIGGATLVYRGVVTIEE